MNDDDDNDIGNSNILLDIDNNNNRSNNDNNNKNKNIISKTISKTKENIRQVRQAVTISAVASPFQREQAQSSRLNHIPKVVIHKTVPNPHHPANKHNIAMRNSLESSGSRGAGNVRFNGSSNGIGGKRNIINAVGGIFGFSTSHDSNIIPSELGLEYEAENNNNYENNVHTGVNIWSKLNVALFLSYALTSAAAAVPVALVPIMASDILSSSSSSSSNNGINNGNIDNGESNTILSTSSSSNFASRLASRAVLGTALGKFVNGPAGDILGARRVAVCYGLALSVTLLILGNVGKSGGSDDNNNDDDDGSATTGGSAAVFTCATVEFLQSVQWPCVAVVLAAHNNNNSNSTSGTNNGSCSNDKRKNSSGSGNESNGGYDSGIYVASMGGRIGSLLSSLGTTVLLRYGRCGWRVLVRLASLVSFIYR